MLYFFSYTLYCTSLPRSSHSYQFHIRTEMSHGNSVSLTFYEFKSAMHLSIDHHPYPATLGGTINKFCCVTSPDPNSTGAYTESDKALHVRVWLCETNSFPIPFITHKIIFMTISSYLGEVFSFSLPAN